MMLVYELWYMILTYDNESCWYMMLVYDVQQSTFSLRYMMITCEHHMWSSYTTVFTTVCDFTCDLWDFHMWSWYMKFGIWSWHMKLVYELRYMMFIYDFTCEHFGVWYMKIIGGRIWISHMIKLADHMPHRIWSYTNIFWKM